VKQKPSPIGFEAQEPKDRFNIDLALTHPTCDPSLITEEMSTEPMYCWKQGDRFGPLVKRSSHWYGRILTDHGEDEFDRALKTIASLVAMHKAFFVEFVQGGGTIELILNHSVELDEGKVLELYIEPSFLGRLAAIGVGLRVQAWSKSWLGTPTS
jgi:hypothetical protein